MVERVVGGGSAVDAVGIKQKSHAEGEIERLRPFVLKRTARQRGRDVVASEQVAIVVAAAELVDGSQRRHIGKIMAVVQVGTEAERTAMHISEIVGALACREGERPAHGDGVFHRQRLRHGGHRADA